MRATANSSPSSFPHRYINGYTRYVRPADLGRKSRGFLGPGFSLGLRFEALALFEVSHPPTSNPTRDAPIC